VEVPQTDIGQPIDDGRRNRLGILHLGERGDDDAPLAGPPYGSLETIWMQFEVNHRFSF
jgi:hypothetical protein